MTDQATPAAAKKALRIAILAQPLRVAGGLSVGRNLLAALARLAPQHSYFVSIPEQCGYEDILRQMPHVQWLVCRKSANKLGRLFFDCFTLPAAVRAFRPDVVLATTHRGLFRPPCPQAILCHEPHLFYPKRHYPHETISNQLVLVYDKLALRLQLRHTQLLLGQTPVAVDRLRQVFDFKGRTAVCPNAVSAFTLAGDDHPTLPEPLTPYASSLKLFCLTNYYGHKNLESFVPLFQRYGRELEGVVVVTTVAAEQHPHAVAFLKAIETLKGRIVNVGPLRQSQLASYFHACQGLLLPTLLESFSGSYLEAMHFGLPILTSDLDFAHAVCGSAALYFDPWNPATMKDAILRLKNEPALREELISKGRQQLQAMFKSWDEIAMELEKMLVDLASR
jgi:glycosyltransferase involved in cell wall biosynthesis